jgi:DegV family protein with EDD domain
MGLTKKFKDHDQEVIADIDWEVYSNKELNDWMRDGIIIKTSQVSNSEFTNVFSKLAREGKDILYIACSSALSGSYNYSLIIKDELLEKYPNRKIICIDSLCAGLGQGSMAIDAAKLQKEGKTIEEVAKYIEENKLCYHQFGTVETLDYLKKAGRVKATAAFFGNIFGVKPIIISDAKGQNYAIFTHGTLAWARGNGKIEKGARCGVRRGRRRRLRCRGVGA